MKLKYTLIIFILFTTSTPILAQNIKGIAYYKSFRTYDKKADTISRTPEADKMMQDLLEQLKSQFEREYKLTFNGQESIYKIEPKLEAPRPNANSGVTITVGGTGDIEYRNLKDSTFIKQTEIVDKAFLVEDKLKKPDWKLENESKTIGQYVCFKATFSHEENGQKFNSVTKDFDSYIKTVVTTVWYTPQIPLSHGPAEHWGLPGLILEVNEGELSLLCYKVILNPSEEIHIEIPSKGKKVDQAEYDEISEKKNTEMREQMRNLKDKNGGSGGFIIGG